MMITITGGGPRQSTSTTVALKKNNFPTDIIRYAPGVYFIAYEGEATPKITGSISQGNRKVEFRPESIITNPAIMTPNEVRMSALKCIGI